MFSCLNHKKKSEPLAVKLQPSMDANWLSTGTPCLNVARPSVPFSLSILQQLISKVDLKFSNIQTKETLVIR